MDPESSFQQGRDNERDYGHQFYENVHGGAAGVLEGVTYGVAYYCRLVWF